MLKGKPFMTTGALFMGLIVVLGAIGIVNGLWSKNLVIHGVVETGDLNADWDCAYSNDDGVQGLIFGADITKCVGIVETTTDDGRDPHGSFNFPYSIPFVEKDVADCIVDIGDRATDGDNFGDQVAYVEISNAYPSYECTISLYLSNTGSIPFNIAGSVLERDETDPIEMLNDECANPLGELQVDPGGERLITCTVHVLQTADQNVCVGTTSVGGVDPTFPDVDYTCTVGDGHYEFAIKVCVAQWNEEATYGECTSSDQHDGPETLDFDGDGIPNADDGCPIEPEDGLDDVNADPAVLPNPDDGCPALT